MTTNRKNFRKPAPYSRPVSGPMLPLDRAEFDRLRQASPEGTRSMLGVGARMVEVNGLHPWLKADGSLFVQHAPGEGT